MIVDNFFLCIFAFFSALSILAKVRLEPVVHTRSRTLAHSTGVLKSFYFHDFSLRAAWNGYQLLKQFWGRNHGKINNSKYARYGPLIWVWTSKFNKISKKLPKLIKHVMWVFEYMSVNWYAIELSVPGTIHHILLVVANSVSYTQTDYTMRHSKNAKFQEFNDF